VAVVALGSALSALQLGQLYGAGKSVAVDGAPELVAMKDLQITVLDAHIALEEVIAGRSDIEEAEQISETLSTAQERAQDILSGDVAGMQSAFAAKNSDARMKLESAVQLIGVLGDLSNQIVEQYRNEGTVSSVLVDQLSRQRQRFGDSMEGLITTVQGRMDTLTTELDATFRQAAAYMAAAVGGALVVALAIAFVFSGRMAARIRRMVELSETAAEGDFTQSVEHPTRDELSQMGSALNDLSVSLSAMISRVKDIGRQVSEGASEVASNSEESASAANQISANAESIRQQTEHQSTSVERVSSAIDTISEQVDGLSDQIEQQAASVNESSASIEEMVANIQSVTKNVEHSKELLADLVESATQGQQVLDAANAKVQEIAKQSDTMLNANQVIATIAGKTNLLAMNAAIEAAHAGSYGQGFAVVADEIRSLAEDASKQSKQVDQQLKGIKESIDDVAESSQKSLTAFNDVRAKIAQVDELEAENESSMQEQSSGSSQVLEALNQINSITEEVRSGAGRMKESNESVRSEMQKVVQTSEEVRQSITEIANGTQEIRQSVAHLSEIGSNNRELVASLQESLSRFRVREEQEEQPADSARASDAATS
jgi:methyl-accepting chemotaxis protein